MRGLFCLCAFLNLIDNVFDYRKIRFQFIRDRVWGFVFGKLLFYHFGK